MWVYIIKCLSFIFLINLFITYSSFGQNINQALSLAYSNHPLLFAERAAGRAASENVTEALSGWRPEVHLDSSIGKKLVTSKLNGGSANTKNNTPITVGVNVTQNIYDAGQREEALKIAESEVLLAHAELMKIENDVLLESAFAYLDLVKEQLLLKIALKNLQVVERQLEATKDRFEVGDVTITDVSQAEARLADALANKVRAESDLESAKASYFSAVGEEAKEILFPQIVPPFPANIQELKEKSSSQNPTVVTSIHREKVAKNKLNLARKELGPSIDLRASVNQSWDPNTFFEEQRYLDLTATLNWPLYRGGKEWSKIRKLREKVTQATAEKDHSIRVANEKALQLWSRIERSKAQIIAYKSSIHANEVALEGVIEEEYVGARTVIDVLDAENELFRAKANLIKAERDLYIYIYSLVAVVGDLNARQLNLPIAVFYNPEEYYNKVRNSWGGIEGERNSFFDVLKN